MAIRTHRLVNLDRVAIKIIELNVKVIIIMVRLKLLKISQWEIVKGLIDENVRLGVSSRGVGSLKRNTKGWKGSDDFKLCVAPM